ncbi:MAG: mechanosensitive ion channel [Lentisphaerae bacterium]|nr:mechanosensitive ion channel [Lentisphaerota bacterium]
MNVVRQFIDPLLQTVGSYLPAIVGAGLVLVIGWLAALALKHLVSALLRKIGVDRRIQDKTGTATQLESFASALIYYAAMVYVLILTLGVLGIQGVLEPLSAMFSRFIGALPDIVAALLLGLLGYVLARICANVIQALAAGLDKVLPRLGLPETFSPSKLLGQLVFIVVFVPILVSALDALQIEAVSKPATEMLGTLMAAIPQILAAALILAVAYVVGRFVTQFLGNLLANLGADSLPRRIGLGALFRNTSLSRTCAGVAFFFIMLAATVSASQKLGFPVLTDIIGQLLVFAGNVVLGLVILGVGTWIANLAYGALSNTSAGGAVAAIARVAIMVLVLAMGLRAMGIAPDIVDTAFLLSLGAVAVAFALSFGLGGREAAGRQLDYWLKKLRKDESGS